MEKNVMRFVNTAIVIASIFLLDQSGRQAAEFRLQNGDTYTGEAANFDDLGLTIRLDGNRGFSSRIGWTKLTQETLRELSNDPRATTFVDPFIEPTPEELERIRASRKKVIVVREVDRIANPERVGLIATLGAPVGIGLAFVLFLANLYAAYEIAVLRQRPVALVCGLSFILPGIGPIIFLSLPSAESEMDASAPPAPEPAETLMANPLAPAGNPAAAAPAGRLGIATAQKPAGLNAGSLEGTVFKRGDTTFNRRFFETKFPGFFRVVPGEAEKDLVLVIRAAKNEYIAKRISRISANEMHIQTERGGGAEAMVPFADVVEVRVRRKDAKS